MSWALNQIISFITTVLSTVLTWIMTLIAPFLQYVMDQLPLPAHVPDAVLRLLKLIRWLYDIILDPDVVWACFLVCCFLELSLLALHIILWCLNKLFAVAQAIISIF